MVYLGGPYHSLKIFKGCLAQILLGPFLSTLIQVYVALSVTNTENLFKIGDMFSKLMKIPFLNIKD